MRLPRSTGLVLAAALAASVLASSDARAMSFPRVKGLEPNVTFWRNVYAIWSQDEIAFHDRKDFRLVYRVVEVPPRSQSRQRRLAIKKAKRELIGALQTLDKVRPKSAEGLEGVEKEVFERLEGIDRADKYRRFSTIRAQNGLREQFIEGYIKAGAYEPLMRERLKLAGLPEDIIALAYLESLMNLRAESHAGARGAWQFMRPTAREYMHVNHVVDERMDPIISADAAAKYLNTALAKVGPWPVAITSYNYGRAGMRRAIRAVGSDDFALILERYHHGRFGLAARNYYASFLAVHDVIKNPRKYLGNVRQRAPWRYDVVRLPFPVLSTQLVGAGAITQRDLVFLNPALTVGARTGQEVLPRGLPLRVPRGTEDAFLAAVLGFSEAERRAAEDHIRKWHRATGRQRIDRIARLYGVDAETLATVNGLAVRSKPRRGTQIAIPSTPVRYSMFPDAKAVPIPLAPALAPAPRVAVSPPKGRASGADSDEPALPRVMLISFERESLEGVGELPGVDAIAAGERPGIGPVDVIAGEAASLQPWEAPPGRPAEPAPRAEVPTS